MANMSSLGFNSQHVPPSTGEVEPIKELGWYVMKIVDSEIKPTKDGNGMRLNLTFEILGGKYAGRKLFEGLNIRNSNPDAQRIAEEDLSAICHSVGIVGQLMDSQQLHNIPLKGKLKLKPASGEYSARNEISAYRHIQDASAILCETAVNGGAAAQGPQGGFAPAQQPQFQPNPAQFAQQQAPAQNAWQQQQAPANYQQQPAQQFQQPAQQQFQPQQQVQNPQQFQQPAQQFQAAPQPWEQPAAQQQQAPANYQQQAPVQQQAPAQQTPPPMAGAGDVPAWAQQAAPQAGQ